MPKDTIEDPTNNGTLHPNKKPISKVGSGFEPMNIEDRDIEITLPEGVDIERPFSLFELYYTDSVIDSMVDAINHYNRDVGEGPWARGREWYPTTPREIWLYLAIRIYMTCHGENEMKDYWSTSLDDPIHPITKYLAKDRFLELHVRYRVGDDDDTIYTRVRPPSIISFQLLIIL